MLNAQCSMDQQNWSEAPPCCDPNEPEMEVCLKVW
jgi:hypothetical protein